MSAQQNLVPNGNFEDTIHCPSNFDQLNNATNWYKPTLGSSDYFNSCNSIPDFLSVPQNVAGYQLAKEGNAYAGFSAGGNSYPFDREYLQVKLLSKLLANKKYRLEFWVSRGDSTNYAVSNIGGLVSQNAPSCNCSGILLNIPQVKESSFIVTSTSWEKISGDFVASGNEEYLTIGHFNNTYDTLKVDNGIFDYTYYYVDNVSIYLLSSDIEQPNVFTPNSDGINDIFKIQSNQKIIDISIYNRWGSKVYQTANETFWDGKSSTGDQCHAGTYYYVIQAETEIYKGFLELIK